MNSASKTELFKKTDQLYTWMKHIYALHTYAKAWSDNTEELEE